jgi:DNA-binding MarR family transcriptional regulator
MTLMQSTTTTDEERAALSTLDSALRPFRELHTSTSPLPFSLLLTFLLIARNEGQTAVDLARAAGITQGALSRQLADLSDVNRHGGVGLGLVESRVEIHDRRYTRTVLTEKGRALVRRDCRRDAGAADGSGGLMLRAGWADCDGAGTRAVLIVPIYRNASRMERYIPQVYVYLLQ